jgi:copper binding plastocyanin/azurin family protein
MTRFLLSLLAAGLLVAAPAAQAASRASQVVYGTVGPGYTITLKTSAGIPVKSLHAGLVVFRISDRSHDHDFHLTGRGRDRSTTVAGVGATVWRLTLKTGTYTFKCDPHELIMIGHFRVV